MGETFSRIEKQKLDNTFVLNMNAESMGFREAAFDLVLCGFVGWNYCFDFVLGEFTGPDHIMAEMKRVLRRGGRVGFCFWEGQEDVEWMEEQFRGYFPELVNENEKDTGRRSLVFSKENAEGRQKILESAGFKNIEIFKERVEFLSVDEECWWEQMCIVGWQRYFKKVEDSHPGQLKRFKQAVFTALRDRKRADGIPITKSVFYAFASKY